MARQSARRTLSWVIGMAAFTLSGAAACLPTVSGQNAGAAIAADSNWRTYVNPRYRYRICYPAGLMRPQGEAENGDGRSFTAADHARVSVFGRNNVDGYSIAQTVDGNAADLAGAGGRVSYRVVRPGWAVYSGDDGKSTLFYSKTIRRGDQFVIFELVYPKAAADRYKPVVERLSQCFATTG